MNSQLGHLILVVLTGWAVTFALRAFPFVVFAGHREGVPAGVEKFGQRLAPVIIAGLVIYSYSGLEWRTLFPYLAGVLTVALQLVFRSSLASIVAGTALYMYLVA